MDLVKSARAVFWQSPSGQTPVSSTHDCTWLTRSVWTFVGVRQRELQIKFTEFNTSKLIEWFYTIEHLLWQLHAIGMERVRGPMFSELLGTFRKSADCGHLLHLEQDEPRGSGQPGPNTQGDPCLTKKSRAQANHPLLLKSCLCASEEARPLAPMLLSPSHPSGASQSGAVQWSRWTPRRLRCGRRVSVLV